MRSWYYIEKEQSRGPIREDRLIELFRSRQLHPDTLVWTNGLTEWVAASRIATLIPPPQQQEPKPSPPSVSLDSKSPNTPPSKAIFLYIPISRLVILSILSAGLYEAYWIYKNWRYIKERDALQILPFWRGIFGIFFCHSLLREIHNGPQTNSIIKAEFPASRLATIWVSVNILCNLTSRIPNGIVNFFCIIISLLTFWCFIPVQKYVNNVNQRIQPKPQYNQWSLGHIVCLVVGMLLWVLIIIGLDQLMQVS